MNQNNRPLGWTTLEEAQQLVEAGLPVETADMSYTWDFDDSRYIITTTPAKNWIVPKYAESTKIKQVLPCWSLGALVQLLPLNVQTDDSLPQKYDLEIKPYSGYMVAYCLNQSHHPMVFTEKHGTLIEACIEMIIWLLNNKFYEQEKC